MSDFVRNHDKIDLEIKNERVRSKSIHKYFLLIDVVFAILIIAIETILWLIRNEILDKGGNAASIEFIVLLFSPILDATFSLILAASAFYMVKSVSNSTGMK